MLAPELELEGVPGDYFALNEYGVPDYYELVVITNDAFLAKNRGAVARFVQALQDAIAFTRAEPKKALALYFKANPEVRKKLDRRAFELVRPYFATTQVQLQAKWADFVRFSVDKGLIAKAIPTEQLFTNVVL